MFQARKGSNYANKLMDLLQNLVHDWPANAAQAYLEGMLINPKGKLGQFHKTDLFVEHFNKVIKELLQGPNTTPELLAKQTAAIFPVKGLIDCMFADLGVKAQDSRHSDVRMDEDVMVLAKYFMKISAHKQGQGKPSSCPVHDLFHDGLSTLAGPSGGRAQHLVCFRQVLD
jgi:hypothetical protein